jgi:hypothetical protein
LIKNRILSIFLVLGVILPKIEKIEKYFINKTHYVIVITGHFLPKKQLLFSVPELSAL